MASKKTGNPVGAPSKYKPEYCDIVIKHGKEGKSLEQIALQLDVSYRTLCNWREEVRMVKQWRLTISTAL